MASSSFLMLLGGLLVEWSDGPVALQVPLFGGALVLGGLTFVPDAIATLATFSFLYAWNSFIWPLIVIDSGNRGAAVLAPTLSVLGGRAADSPNLILAGVILAIAAPITVFIFAQRAFVENAQSSGLKG